ncbi:MAG: hypothetical protein V4592_26075 [Bacteroidota bacterium]
MLYNQNNLQPGQDVQSAAMGKAMEGQPMGGHNFGKQGTTTPTGDDKDNPSRNAGYTNPYFARTEPSDEDTANNNFKAAHQQGEPNYDKAQRTVNIPGPQEVPDQQKVGEDSGQQEMQQQSGDDNSQNDGEQEHIET